MTAAATPPERRPCPSDEHLIAWLVGETPALAGPKARGVAAPPQHERHDAIAAHVLACDRCVAELRIARTRLCLAAEIDTPVPAAVAARATGAETAARVPASDLARDWLQRLREIVRLPLLVPVAAALALVLVGVPDRGREPLPEESTRDVPLRQKARVTAARATLHASPAAGAATTAEIGRGDAVFLLAENAGWVQVELADGRAGWMKRSAFE